ncbi:MAG TPA: carbohydrate-binding family 9-like protein [Humisphaera sp.]
MRKLLLICPAVALVAFLAVRSAPADPPSATAPAATRPDNLDADWAPMRPIVPRGYVCRRAAGPVTVDGKPDEPAWADAPWTDDFVDIEGSRRPNPRFRTRAKMLWDDAGFYVYAELEEPHVWGTITRRNQVIFHDNDFEVFVDPDGDNHNYYEFEMNALNTVWELSLDKPYRDGGPARDPGPLAGLRSAVHVNGTLNAPGDTDRSWSVEVAFPWAALKPYAGARACPPGDGDQWRVNFSRVEWLVDIIDGKYRKIPKEMRAEDNWVWSPQGAVDMHRPERWGYVQFSSSAATADFRPDPALAARDAVMGAYHRQQAYRKQAGRYAASAAELGLAADARPAVEVTATPNGFNATSTLKLPDGSARTARVREDSKLTVE